MTNRWNRVIYKLWSPHYDALFDRFFFAAGRQRTFELLQLRPHERVLLVGVGTGADLAFLPAGTVAVGVDYSPDMLAQARPKLPATATVSLIRGDAQQLPLTDHTFDVAILTLILSVVPDGQACWREVLRTLRPGGRAIIFDKFLPDHQSPNFFRRWLNRGAQLLGTDLNRHLAQILAGTDYRLILNEPSLLNGMYRIVLIESPGQLKAK